MSNYHPDGCTFTRGECLHPNDKCSECGFLYEHWKDELAPYFDSAYEKGRADVYEEFLKILNEIYDWVWDVDIPSPTCPEYIEHHKDCLEIMAKIKDKINYCYGKLKEQRAGEQE